MRLFVILLASFLYICPSTRGAEPETGRLTFEAKPFKTNYVLEVPTDYSDQKTWPIIVALHGMGGKGKDFIGCWARPAAAAGFIVAAPDGDAETPCRCGQCDDMVRTWSLKSEKYILWMIEEIGKKYRIDEDAVFLNGFSAGAQLALYLAVRNPATFAGTVPVGGGMIRGIGPERLGRAKKLPVYLMVGGRDPASGMVRAVGERLKKLEFEDVTILEIPGIGHEFPIDRIPPLFDWFKERREARKHARRATKRMLHEGLQAFAAGRYAPALEIIHRLEAEAFDPAAAGKARTLLAKIQKIGEERLWKASESLLAGDRESARKAFQSIIRDFPGLPCAKKAEEEAKALRREKTPEEESDF